MKSPAEILRSARRIVLLLAGTLVLYGFLRFDVVLLPSGARSPLYGLHAGDRLLVDRHARRGSQGELWLFRGPAGELLIGRVGAPPAELDARARDALAQGALWLCCEREIGGVPDSRTLGPIPAEARAGRVLFVLPW